MTHSCMITHTCYLSVIRLVQFNWCATQDTPFNPWVGHRRKHKKNNLNHPLMVVANIHPSHPSVHLTHLSVCPLDYMIHPSVHPLGHHLPHHVQGYFLFRLDPGPILEPQTPPSVSPLVIHIFLGIITWDDFILI
jgi:hypothetical protein